MAIFLEASAGPWPERGSVRPCSVTCTPESPVAQNKGLALLLYLELDLCQGQGRASGEGNGLTEGVVSLGKAPSDGAR